MTRRLITDRDVLTGAVSSPIVLDAQTLLTPAARDRAVAKGMVIVERDAASAPAAQGCARCGRSGCAGGCGEAAAASPRHGAPVLGQLPDGLYLVRVEGGRTVDVHPATGPGLL